MTGPYREDPRWLVCPRCDEMLEEVFEGVSACPRCAGSWISQAVIDAAFGNPIWPGGASAWWRRELACPECTVEGSKALLDAMETGGIIVDRCRGHGTWFDDGELGRLMNATGDEHEALRAQLGKVDRQVLAAARERYARSRAVSRAERAALRAEAEEAQRRAEEEARAARAEQERLLAQEAARAQREAQHVNALIVGAQVSAELKALDDRRLEIERTIARGEAELVALNRQVARTRSDLDRARAERDAIDTKRAELNRR